MSKASNAVLALSRAFYGKRLTDKDYDNLIACKTLNEFAQYLRTRTDYAKQIDESGTTEFTSKGLEQLVGKHSIENFASICRYELAIGSEFYRYFIVRDEIDQILNCTLYMLGNSRENYLMRMNPFLDKHLDIDLFALAKAQTLEDISKSLEKTPYKKIYDRCLSSDTVNYLTFEKAFEAYFESVVKKLVKKCFSGREDDELYKIICRSLDCKFIEKIYRTIKYYPDDISLRSFSSPAFVTMTLFSEKDLADFANCKTQKEFLNRLSKTPYKGWVSDDSSQSLEYQLEKQLYLLCRKQIRFSSYPSVVMFCYLLLTQNETSNLVRIIEGIKYNVPAQVIKSNIIIQAE